MYASLVYVIVLCTRWSAARYNLQHDYVPAHFSSMFDFFTDPDPTHGFVVYIDETTATNSGLFRVQDDSVYLGVDNTSITTAGRPSVRLQSKASYNHALVVLDLAHMPGGICGTWPAFWMTGPGWPNSGEIDIVEGVNTQKTNSMALHTADSCAILDDGSFTGTVNTDDCFVDAADQDHNVGCQIVAAEAQSYGDGFNENSGGIFAMQWTSAFIKIWMFTRADAPQDLATANPDPTSWQPPSASFSGRCILDDRVKDQNIVRPQKCHLLGLYHADGRMQIFDTTFCGDWAGKVWATDSVCASRATTCETFVSDHPAEFSETYWMINSLRVYQDSEVANTSFIPSQATAANASGLVQMTNLLPSPIISGIWSNITKPALHPSRSSFPARFANKTH